MRGLRVTLGAAFFCSAALGFAGPATAALAGTGSADSAGQQLEAARSNRGVVLTSPASEVEEGDQVVLNAQIKRASSAARVSLQKFVPPLYEGDEAEWTLVETKRVRGRGSVPFEVVATDHNQEKYRAVAAYRGHPPAASRPLTLVVWRWIPLSDYDPYYEAQPYSTAFGTVQINGRPYNGWGPYTHSHSGAWESRFTPGRHCRAFRSVVGVADISHDESSGTVTLTADDVVVYESPSLTPGMEIEMSVPLDVLPYRFGVQLFDTSPGGTSGRDDIESWPVLGEPAFNCTGV